MAVTRIKNNQVTDATLTGAKLVDLTVTAGKLANNLTYASNLTVSGNLTVNGATNTISTVNTTIEDAVIVLNSEVTGSSGARDMGLYGERGDDTSVFMGYDESADIFVMATTDSAGTATAINITDYVGLKAGPITTDDTIVATANITGGNLITGAQVVATGNVTGANLNTAGKITDGALVSSDGTITGAVAITASGAIQGGTLTDGTFSVNSGAVTGATTLSTSGLATLATATVSDLTDNQVVVASTSGRLANTNKLTFDETTLGVTGAATISTTLGVTGLSTLATAVVSDLTADQICVPTTDGRLASTNKLTFDETTLGVTGAITASTTIAATANITGGNLITGAQVVATGNITGANLNTAAKVVSGSLETGDVTIGSSKTLAFGANKLTGVADPANAQDAATKAYVDGLLSSGFTVSDGSNTQTIANGNTLTVSGTANEITAVVSATDTLTLSLPDDVTIGDTLTVAGNLIVQGTTTTVNSSVTQVSDPIFQLGRGASGAALESDDAKDRGISMFYYEGSEKTAFMGFDTTANTFKYFSDASITSEVVSGTMGTAEFGSVVVDNLTLDANTITSTNTNGNLELAANGSGKVNIATGNELVIADLADGKIIFSSSGQLSTNSNLGFDGSTLAVTGAITASTTIAATANITGGNLITGAQVVATGNVTGANLNTAGKVVAGTVMDSATIHTSGLATLHSATVEDLTADQLLVPTTGGRLASTDKLTFDETTLAVTGAATISTTLGVTGLSTLATATVSDLTDNQVVVASTSGRLANTNKLTFDESTLGVTGAITASTTMTATGNIGGGNIAGTRGVFTNVVGTLETAAQTNVTSLGTLSALTVDNVVVNGNDITVSSGELTFNDASADFNIRFEGNGDANLLFLDAGTDSVNIGTATAIADVKLNIGATTSFMPPKGTSAQRPSSAVVGMLRFNTTTDSIEQYSSADGWESVGAVAFTTIASQTFNGDSSTVAFTLSEAQTTASCIVSINGVVQLPTDAYAVSGTTMTFTEAPATGDKVEVRKITTTTTITNLSSASGEATVTAQTSEEVDIKGNLMPTVNNTYSIGNASVGWTTVHAEATSAKYADLAEKYEADADYTPGTVVHFGGEKEVTECDLDHCTQVAGVVSTAPGYRMNDGLEAEHTAMVALTGRVPCKVTGPVAKGDMMVSAGNGMARAEANPTYGAVIGKALEVWEGGEGVIEVVIK